MGACPLLKIENDENGNGKRERATDGKFLIFDF
jgi:hypothetical protein